MSARGAARAPVLLWIASVALTGCYLGHDGDVPRDAGRDGGRDAGTPRGDATTRPIDAGPPPDAGPVPCERFVVVSQIRLDDRGGVAPRLVALSYGDVGVVYVRPDGSPSRVVYQRLTAGLLSLSGPITVATDAIARAEPAVVADTIAIAYGRAGGTERAFVRIRFDGTPAGAPATVPLGYPSVLLPTPVGLFWMGSAMRTEGNVLELAHVDASGTLLSPRADIVLGRYDTGYGAIARPERSEHVITYAREVSLGVRRGYARSIDASGVLGPERLLGDESDGAVVPGTSDAGLVLVRVGGQLVLDRVHPDAHFELLERATHPPIATTPLVTSVRGRLLVAHVVADALAIDDFGAGITRFERIVAALPPGTSSASTGSVLSVSDGAVIALTLGEDGTSYPWLVRLQCDAAP